MITTGLLFHKKGPLQDFSAMTLDGDDIHSVYRNLAVER